VYETKKKVKLTLTYETVTIATWTQRRYDRSLSSDSGTKIPRRVLPLALSRVTGRAQTIAVKGQGKMSLTPKSVNDTLNTKVQR
jgi:hypothetical protein